MNGRNAGRKTNMNPLKLTVISLTVVLCAVGGGYLFVNYDNSSLDVSNENICDRKLNYAWIGVSEPFILGTANAPSGTDIEILNSALAVSGCKAHIKSLDAISWKRNLALLGIGNLDIVMLASWSEERDKYAYFSDPYRSSYLAVFIRSKDLDSEKFKINAIDDLTKYNFTLGIGRGFVYGEKVDKLIKKLKDKVKVSNKVEKNRRLLKSKLIDGYISYIPTEPLVLKEGGLEDKVKILPNSIVKTGDIHFMLSKQSTSKELLQAINQGLKEIKSNGTYDRIIKKYQEPYSFPIL